MKKFFMFCMIVVCMNGKSGFQKYGDVMQFLPVFLAGYELATQDYKGLKDISLSAGVVFLGTTAIKYSFVGISKIDPKYASISKRPDSDSYDGFPSGHTSFAFSAVGFAQKHYGWKVSLPVALLAGSVGVSRVYAKRHTATQVLVGALFGFGVSYFLSEDMSDSIQLETTADNGYKLQITRRF